MPAAKQAPWKKATENADKKLEEWNEKSYNGFSYIFMPANEEGHYNVIMLNKTYSGSVLTKNLADTCVKQVYKELSKCFAGYDIKIGIIVAKDSKTILYVYTADMLAELK